MNGVFFTGPTNLIFHFSSVPMTSCKPFAVAVNEKVGVPRGATGVPRSSFCKYTPMRFPAMVINVCGPRLCERTLRPRRLPTLPPKTCE